MSIKLGQCLAVLRFGNLLGPLSTSFGIFLKNFGISLYAGLGTILSIDRSSSFLQVIIIFLIVPPLFIY